MDEEVITLEIVRSKRKLVEEQMDLPWKRKSVIEFLAKKRKIEQMVSSNEIVQVESTSCDNPSLLPKVSKSRMPSLTTKRDQKFDVLKNLLILSSRKFFKLHICDHECKQSCTGFWILMWHQNKELNWMSTKESCRKYIKDKGKSLLSSENYAKSAFDHCIDEETFTDYKKRLIDQYVDVQFSNLAQRGKSEIEELYGLDGIKSVLDTNRNLFIWDNNSCAIDSITSIFPVLLYVLIKDGYFQDFRKGFVCPAGIILALQHYGSYCKSKKNQKMLSNHSREVVMAVAQDLYGKDIQCWKWSSQQPFMEMVHVIQEVFVPFFSSGGKSFGGSQNKGLVDTNVHIVNNTFFSTNNKVSDVIRKILNGKIQKGIHILSFNITENLKNDWNHFFDDEFTFMIGQKTVRIVAGISYRNEAQQHFVSCCFNKGTSGENEFYICDGTIKRASFKLSNIQEAVKNAKKNIARKGFLFEKMHLVCTVIPK